MKKHFLFFAFAAASIYTQAQNTFPSSGNVGIGTLSPQQRLHVEGANNQAIFVSTSAPGAFSGSGMIGYLKALPTASGQRLGYFLFGSRGGAQNAYNPAGMAGFAAGPWTAGSSYPTYIIFETTPSGSVTRVERMRIDQNGNVGIGKTNPQYRFHVEGANNQGIFVNTSALSPTAGSGVTGAVKQLPTAAGQRLGFFLVGSRGGAESQLNSAGMTGFAEAAWSGSSRPTYLAFETTPSGSTTRTERVRITGNGLVGIGTASPAFQLDVQSPGFSFGRFKAGGGYAGVILDKSAANQNEYVVHRAAGTDLWTEGTIGNNNFSIHNWGGTGTDAVTIDVTNNNLGIGTSTPANRLVVTATPGNAVATALVQNLTGTGFADGLYVQAGTNTGSGSWYLASKRPDGVVIGSISQATATSVAYNTTSDKRLKTNIRDTKFGLPDVNKIQVKDYNFIGESSEQTGFLAQQLYEVFPEAVSKGGDDPKARPWMVDYGRVTPLLVKAIQDMDVQNQAKEDRIKKLEDELAELKLIVQDLKSGRNNTYTNASSGYLEQSTPNPARSATLIRYGIPDGATSARLTLVNTKGQTLKEMSLAGRGAGQVNLNTTALPSGVYTYTLWVDGRQADSKQLVIAK